MLLLFLSLAPRRGQGRGRSSLPYFLPTLLMSALAAQLSHLPLAVTDQGGSQLLPKESSVQNREDPLLRSDADANADSSLEAGVEPTHRSPRPHDKYEEGPMPTISDSLFSLIILIYVSVIFIFMFFAFCWKQEPPQPDPGHKDIPMITSILEEMEKQQAEEENSKKAAAEAEAEAAAAAAAAATATTTVQVEDEMSDEKKKAAAAAMGMGTAGTADEDEEEMHEMQRQDKPLIEQQLDKPLSTLPPLVPPPLLPHSQPKNGEKILVNVITEKASPSSPSTTTSTTTTTTTATTAKNPSSSSQLGDGGGGDVAATQV